ncbi:hypothetical protein NDU88_000510 [Pleurodeles waltl]|uniref:Uncharacterized protein n=1 Tax=Pleurodeles waltl TaxID=8319 RepID=A0AAV7L731_PLEWA|nr:hypothetical protein NDU88_000510 [Pleurodeles waltl]
MGPSFTHQWKPWRQQLTKPLLDKGLKITIRGENAASRPGEDESDGGTCVSPEHRSARDSGGRQGGGEGEGGVVYSKKQTQNICFTGVITHARPLRGIKRFAEDEGILQDSVPAPSADTKGSRLGVPRVSRSVLSHPPLRSSACDTHAPHCSKSPTPPCSALWGQCHISQCPTNAISPSAPRHPCYAPSGTASLMSPS